MSAEYTADAEQRIAEAAGHIDDLIMRLERGEIRFPQDLKTKLYEAGAATTELHIRVMKALTEWEPPAR